MASIFAYASYHLSMYHTLSYPHLCLLKEMHATAIRLTHTVPLLILLILPLLLILPRYGEGRTGMV